jgi:hypothetical protein
MEITIKIPKINPWLIISLILAIALVVVIFQQQKPKITGAFILSKEEIGKKVIDYINNNLVPPGTNATLVKVEDMGTFYEILTSYQGQQIPVYATKDGKYMFLQSFNLSEKIERPTQQAQQAQQQEIPKRDRPEARVFVMSFCPFGLQFLKAYIPVIELLGKKADLQVSFVDYIMHGEKEFHGNNFLYCVQRVENEKFTKYLRCFVESGDYEKCLDSSGIDKTKVKNCIDSIDKQFNLTNLFKDQSTWLSGRFPKYPVEEELNTKYGVQGSPTFVINGKVVSIERSAEAIKRAICSAFNSPPEECNRTLRTEAESPGIGPIGSGSGTSGGRC